MLPEVISRNPPCPHIFLACEATAQKRTEPADSTAVSAKISWTVLETHLYPNVHSDRSIRLATMPMHPYQILTGKI